MSTASNALLKLKLHCERAGFSGWDPYDGLNSRVFQATPLKKSRVARLGLIQLCRRSPLNLRRLLRVPKGHNAKGIALLLSGYCNMYRLALQGDRQFGEATALLDQVNTLAQLLLQLRSPGYSGACWGYNFDWQSKAFFLPSGTPTVVATSFAVEALLNAFELTQNGSYLDSALSSADFVLNDLRRIPKPGGRFMFSYSPCDSQAVYNATLLGTKILSSVYAVRPDGILKEAAYTSAKAVCEMQNEDGSFPHSDQVGNKWRDNFHTAFKLESLHCYQTLCHDDEFSLHIQRGFDYWVSNFFDHKTGLARYYDQGMSPELIDLHCAAQALVTFNKLGRARDFAGLLGNIVDWSVENMQSPTGYFYAQKVGKLLNKIDYMRWPNAWMLYGLSYFLLPKISYDTN